MYNDIGDIAMDKKLADALNVKGTPSVYINGREFDVRQDMGEWISLELQMIAEGSAKPSSATTTVAPAGSLPSASGSAKAVASGAPSGKAATSAQASSKPPTPAPGAPRK